MNEYAYVKDDDKTWGQLKADLIAERGSCDHYKRKCDDYYVQMVHKNISEQHYLAEIAQLKTQLEEATRPNETQQQQIDALTAELKAAKAAAFETKHREEMLNAVADMYRVALQKIARVMLTDVEPILEMVKEQPKPQNIIWGETK